MATALDFISLEEAKEFLRVDFADEDSLITSFIGSAVEQIEKATEERLYQRDEVIVTKQDIYTLLSYPVNQIKSVVDKYGNAVEFEAETIEDTLISLPCDQTKKIITVDVGYTEVNPAPKSLKEACLQLIEHKYNNRSASGAIPESILQTIAPYRRLTWF